MNPTQRRRYGRMIRQHQRGHGYASRVALYPYLAAMGNALDRAMAAMYEFTDAAQPKRAPILHNGKAPR